MGLKGFTRLAIPAAVPGVCECYTNIFLLCDRGRTSNCPRDKEGTVHISILSKLLTSATTFVYFFLFYHIQTLLGYINSVNQYCI